MSADYPDRDRVARTGRLAATVTDLSVIDAVIAQQRAALDASRPDERARLAYALAFAMNQRFQRTGDLGDIRAAIPHLQTAVAAAVGDPYEARFVSELGAAMGQVGAADESTEGTVLVHEAVRLTERAAGLTPVGHPHHAIRIAAHGMALCRLDVRRNSTVDLDTGVERLREALRVAHPDDPRVGWILCQLALGLTARGTHVGSARDLDEALEAAGHAGIAANPYDATSKDIPVVWTQIRQLRAQRTGRS